MGWMGAALGIASSLFGAKGKKDEGKEAKRAAQSQAADAKWNEKMDKKRAEDAKQRGAMEADQMAMQTRQLLGRQRSLMGASGVIADAGTFADVLDDTEAAGLQDQGTILQNAMREAYGYTQSAKNWRRKYKELKGAGAKAEKAGNAGAVGSMITGAINAGSSMGWW